MVDLRRLYCMSKGSDLLVSLGEMQPSILQGIKLRNNLHSSLFPPTPILQNIARISSHTFWLNHVSCFFSTITLHNPSRCILCGHVSHELLSICILWFLQSLFTGSTHVVCELFDKQLGIMHSYSNCSFCLCERDHHVDALVMLRNLKLILCDSNTRSDYINKCTLDN